MRVLPVSPLCAPLWLIGTLKGSGPLLLRIMQRFLQLCFCQCSHASMPILDGITLSGHRVRSFKAAANQDTGGKYAVLSSTAIILVYIAFFAGVIRPHNTPLGVLDEVEDDVPFLGLRETCLHLRTTVGDVVALEIDGVIDVLDVADDI